MTDRRTPPPFKAIEKIALPDFEKHFLANRQPVYGVNTGQQPAVKIEVIIGAGTKHEAKRGIAMMASKMLLGGTTNYTATQLAEQFSQYGGFTEVSQNAEQLSFSVYGLAHQLENLLPLMAEVLTNATIPASEFNTQQQIAVQQLQVNLEKTSFKARRELLKQLFGDDHPLGTSPEAADITAVTDSEVRQFYTLYIKTAPFAVFMSGKYTDKHIQLLNSHLGTLEITETTEATELPQPENTPKKIIIEKEGSLQSSIRLGRILFTRKHPDYFPFIVANTVFGGYFGSRLMKNIREDKGFTYGISSSIIPSKSVGYFVIGTDVKREFTQQTLDEVAKEIKILQTEPVPAGELTTVKNYMIGSLAGSINNPFDIADKQKMLVREELTLDYYANYVKKINAVTANDVMRIMQEYLNPADLTEIVVGGK